MGLSGRKVKQRIGNDPRNLSWADNAAKFGQTYLEKFGWDSSKGLGASGDGRLSHIKVAQKLDMLGLGAAAHRNNPDGIAWKQNHDFEALLKRLNGDTPTASSSISPELTSMFQKPQVLEAESEDTAGPLPQQEIKEKRTRKEGDLEDKKERKRRKKAAKEAALPDSPQSDNISGDSFPPTSSPTPVPETPSTPSMESQGSTKRHIPRHRAHRARAMVAKRLSSKDSSSISEILGISPLSVPGASQQPQLGPASNPGCLTTIEDHPTMEKLTTSSQSIADYFKQRLAAKTSSTSSGTTTVPGTPDLDVAEDFHPSRMGLGGARSALPGHQFSFSEPSSPVIVAPPEDEDSLTIDPQSAPPLDIDCTDGTKAERRRRKEERRAAKAAHRASRGTKKETKSQVK